MKNQPCSIRLSSSSKAARKLSSGSNPLFLKYMKDEKARSIGFLSTATNLICGTYFFMIRGARSLYR